MAFTFGRVRHIALAMIGAGSVLAGLFFAFRLVTPALIVQLPTPELVGLLGLLIFPPLTAWAIWADQNALAKLPPAADPLANRILEPKSLTIDDTELDAELAAGAAAPGSEVELVAEQVSEPEVHAPGRRTVRHRRHDPVRAST